MEDYTQMSVNRRIALILKEVYGGILEKDVRSDYDMIADKLKKKMRKVSPLSL